MQFKVRRILSENIQNEIQKIGFSPSYLSFGANKHKFLNIKIYNQKPEAATIIKQTALSSGTDAAVHRGVLDHSAELSDVILSGTIAQLQNVAQKLKLQQFSLNRISDEILKQIEIFERNSRFLSTYDNSDTLSTKKHCPKIMGILNITENSFSDGGKFLDPKCAIEHVYKMIEEGAQIIDIGAESTRPGSEAVPSDVEIQRIMPILKEIRSNSACKNIQISIDTRNSATAAAAADLGVDIINDVSGLAYDKNMAKIIQKTGLDVVIMHSRGTPKDMDTLCNYKNATEEVYFELLERVQTALNEGISPEKIIIDPGFGFAKNNEQNFEIISKIEEFKSAGFKLLCGLSRKRFIKSLLKNSNIQDETNLETLDFLTAQTSFYFALKGVDIIRVHNVLKTRQALDLAEKLI